MTASIILRRLCHSQGTPLETMNKRPCHMVSLARSVSQCRGPGFWKFSQPGPIKGFVRSSLSSAQAQPGPSECRPGPDVLRQSSVHYGEPCAVRSNTRIWRRGVQTEFKKEMRYKRQIRYILYVYMNRYIVIKWRTH